MRDSQHVCHRCGNQLSLARTEPHPKYINVTIRVFACDCGEITSDIVANMLQADAPQDNPPA